MWKFFFVLFFSVAIFAGDEAAAGMRHIVRSGIETQVHYHNGNTYPIDEATHFKITQGPVNGSARVAVTNQASSGKPIRVALVFYKSKPGFVGADSFSYERINRDGSVKNFTLSVGVVP